MAHPDVAEAVAFGVPHRMWGEAIAAVVLRDQSTCTDAELGVHRRRSPG